ncbi:MULTISPECIES: YecR family lipoprotein [Pseudomonas]|uniref:Lipoprotein n=1 Tax=Pseudomonas lactis TaxID=1615674 RepID=A0ABS9FTF5_9PSED|nr:MULTISPECIES: YecR family lipoprotein [Pseudomonas]MBI6978204.1 hypothetical protein [Pseudomonas lactis]MCF4973512.1 hypothetical protein [Pseudomonas lactis]MCF5003106.1 hypothetical protein [Pseudomonas lactis]MCF5007427.1 hypothetical protein [Pseudomonas lactis]MCF5015070.1 hypothetical protein [Pseudomonas lactis]
MKSVIVAIALPLIAGCATPKYWEATGGNPSDGLVQLSYVHTPFEYGQIRESQGLAIATGRCQFWDYQRAEPAGKEKSECRTMGPFHCLETTVTQDYRCLQ